MQACDPLHSLFALFAYTHVSHEGGFPLDDFPKIRAWIERVKAQRFYLDGLIRKVRLQMAVGRRGIDLVGVVISWTA